MLQMIEFFFQADVIYNAIIPIFLILLGWTKGSLDVRRKNKALGYWKKKYRKVFSFYNIAMTHYVYFFLITEAGVIICELVRKIWKKELYGFVGVICSVINIIVMLAYRKKGKVKIDLLKNSKQKKIILWAIYFMVGMAFFDRIINDNVIVLMIYAIALIIWSICVNKYSERIYILDKPYANIHIKESEPLIGIYVGGIRKKGEWLIVNWVNENDNEMEVRVRESDVLRVDYYGEPLVIVENI